MVIKLLHTVLLFLFPSMTVIGQVLDTDTLCYKNNTVYQELIIKESIKKNLFRSIFYQKGEQVDVYKGYASISDYAYISSETDFTEDGSLYPVIEYWYEDPDIPLSIRVNYDMGVARISFAENLSLPYIYKLKRNKFVDYRLFHLTAANGIRFSIKRI